MTHNIATPPVVNYSSSTTAEAARAAPDQPPHPPKDPRCTATAQHAAGKYSRSVREFVDADVIMLLRCLGISMLFPCFYDPPPYRGPRTAPFDAPRSPLAEFGVGARSFAGDPEGFCVGRAWHGRAAAGDRVALGRAVPKRGILEATQM